MALYGISILFVGLVLSASLANYHFGTNLSTFLLCEWPSCKSIGMATQCLGQPTRHTVSPNAVAVTACG
jgi:hypothetical protein